METPGLRAMSEFSLYSRRPCLSRGAHVLLCGARPGGDLARDRSDPTCSLPPAPPPSAPGLGSLLSVTSEGARTQPHCTRWPAGGTGVQWKPHLKLTCVLSFTAALDVLSKLHLPTAPPPLNEGESLVSRILQLGPPGTKFLG